MRTRFFGRRLWWPERGSEGGDGKDFEEELELSGKNQADYRSQAATASGVVSSSS